MMKISSPRVPWNFSKWRFKDKDHLIAMSRLSREEEDHGKSEFTEVNKEKEIYQKSTLVW
jgi:hypothetical protein